MQFAVHREKGRAPVHFRAQPEIDARVGTRRSGLGDEPQARDVELAQPAFDSSFEFKARRNSGFFTQVRSLLPSETYNANEYVQ
jgi:hypothetical protein